MLQAMAMQSPRSERMQEELREKFRADHELVIRPGSDNFFDGGPYPQDNPVCEQQMVAAVREYYNCWAAGDVQGKLSGAISPVNRMSLLPRSVAVLSLPVMYRQTQEARLLRSFLQVYGVISMYYHIHTIIRCPTFTS
jgi:hypothetical protein